MTSDAHAQASVGGAHDTRSPQTPRDVAADLLVSVTEAASPPAEAIELLGPWPTTFDEAASLSDDDITTMMLIHATPELLAIRAERAAVADDVAARIAYAEAYRRRDAARLAGAVADVVRGLPAVLKFAGAFAAAMWPFTVAVAIWIAAIAVHFTDPADALVWTWPSGLTAVITMIVAWTRRARKVRAYKEAGLAEEQVPPASHAQQLAYAFFGEPHYDDCTLDAEDLGWAAALGLFGGLAGSIAMLLPAGLIVAGAYANPLWFAVVPGVAFVVGVAIRFAKRGRTESFDDQSRD